MDPFQRFYISAINFLKFRQRSIKEVRDNLKKKKAPPEIIDQVIEKLIEKKFVNDHEFVRWWIEQRTTYKPRSLRMIKQELQMKGISTEIIDEEMASYEPAVDRAPADDLSQAKALAQKKMSRYKNLPDDKKKEKIMRLLASRGFSYDIIKDIFREFDLNKSTVDS